MWLSTTEKEKAEKEYRESREDMGERGTAILNRMNGSLSEKVTKWKPGGRKNMSHWIFRGRAFQARGYCKCEALVCSRSSKKTSKTGKEWAIGSAVADKVREVNEVRVERALWRRIQVSITEVSVSKITSHWRVWSRGICFVKKVTEVRQEGPLGCESSSPGERRWWLEPEQSQRWGGEMVRFWI